MSEAEIIAKINDMSHAEMARAWRFEPPGSIYFIRDTPICGAFDKRWRALGGWNPALSKQIGFKP